MGNEPSGLPKRNSGGIMDFKRPPKARTNINVESVEGENLNQATPIKVGALTAEPVTQPAPEPVATPEPTSAEPTNPVVSQAAEATPQSVQEPVPVPAPEPEPISETNELEQASIGVVTNLDGSAPDSSLDPMNRPMEKAPTVIEEKPRKLRKGYFIATLICVLIAAACAVTAVLLLMDKGRPDPVGKAVQKIINGEAPENVGFEGTITVNSPEDMDGISQLKMSLKGSAISSSLINTTSADLEFITNDGDSLNIKLEEMYASEGDLFIKINGIPALLTELSKKEAEPLTTNCLDDAADGLETNCGEAIDEDMAYEPEENPMLPIITSMFSGIENTWLRLSKDELTSVLGGTGGQNSCLISLAQDVLNSRNSISELYDKNPFVVSSTKNLKVESKLNPIYQVGVDDEKFTNFVRGLNGLAFVNSYLTCSGMTNVELDAGKLLDAVKDSSGLYVEIDKDYNFTRVYTKHDDGRFDSWTEIDLDFTYPENVNVSEPQEYSDFSEIFAPIITMFYPTTGEDVVEGVVEETN